MVAPMPHIERRWQLVKVLERDGQLLEKLKLSQGVFDKLEVLITRFEQQADDDAASIIASGRYQKIDSMLRSCYKSANVDYANTVSEKIDRIVTNRVLGLPIFLGIMWAVYYICIQTLGDETIGWWKNYLKASVNTQVLCWKQLALLKLCQGSYLMESLAVLAPYLALYRRFAFCSYFCLSWKTVLYGTCCFYYGFVFSGNSGFQASRYSDVDRYRLQCSRYHGSTYD